MDGCRLIMNDGTEIENGEAGLSSIRNLWLWLPGYTMAQAAALAFDTGKTERITFRFGEQEETYEHFTECRHINMEADGRAAVCLVEEAGNNV